MKKRLLLICILLGCLFFKIENIYADNGSISVDGIILGIKDKKNIFVVRLKTDHFVS